LSPRRHHPWHNSMASHQRVPYKANTPDHRLDEKLSSREARGWGDTIDTCLSYSKKVGTSGIGSRPILIPCLGLYWTAKVSGRVSRNCEHSSALGCQDCAFRRQ